MKKNVKVFYLLRRSTTKQVNSFERQYQEIEAFRKALGLPEPHPDDIFKDEASGENLSREMLARLTASFKSKGYTYGFIHSIDRIGRSLEVISEFVKLLEEYDIKLCIAASKTVIDVKENGFQKKFLILVGVLPEIEKRLRGERIRMGLRNKKLKNGKRDKSILLP